MDEVADQLSLDRLEQGLADVLATPRDSGPLLAIYSRPAVNQRRELARAELSVEGGLAGDRWATAHWQMLPDGTPDPRSQLTLMNARVLRLLAGSESAMSLAGDNLIVDLDLCEENLPVGTRLQVGETVMLEITDQPHTGCGKFARRYGVAARDFVNRHNSAGLNLRGRYARIVVAGSIAPGDLVTKL